MAYLVNRSYGAGLARGFASAFNGFGLDVQRNDAGYSVQIPVPGFAPDQIEVTLEENVLCVKGDTEQRHFARSIQVPDEIDANTIAAKVEHGLLTLTLNLQAKAAPRKIAISTN